MWKDKLNHILSLGRNFTVEFKIGTTRMYVLKDAFTFDDYMKNRLTINMERIFSLSTQRNRLMKNPDRWQNLSVNGQIITDSFTDLRITMAIMTELWRK